ncbi:hemagglutinin repeat-containing protein [Pantoea sp. SM3]|uniref:hemagglutinin repeat-containing protein n=1 Tax=Pantoea sp. SM3 TaxID=1628192 RepID=UPI0006976A47|nr:hemagglutinin repeat-containing protein [Pantoea sp. SM3]
MDDRQPVSLARRALSYLICYLVAVQPMLPAMAAQITPVTPGTKMDAAGNGVPVVNIATPNAAGVSHNQYQQYNVGQEGLILNNATGQLNQTQLGGLIQNNPNLKAGHEAQAIINEVTGANRSQLQGYTEVAGKAANVIVANPYGITCNGCGFINTPNVTLTTGKPQLDANGNLSSLEVTKGSVTVEGKGLDGSGADAVSIVARATEINAGIHAKDLSVTVGANRVGANGSVTPIAGEGAVPSVAVDTGALGGMYANRIHLVSSEKGVGVNLGNLAAKQGDIQLDANGKLTLGNSLSSGALTANGASVALNGDNKATGQITVNAQQDATLGKGTLVSDAGIAVTAKGNLTTGGTSLTAGRDIRLSGANLAADQSTRVNAGSSIQLQAQNQISNSGQFTAADNLSVDTRQLNNSGALAASTISVKAGTLQNSKGASVAATRSLTTVSNSLLNQGVFSAPVLDISSAQTENSGMLQGTTAISFSGSSLNNLSGGTLSSNNAFSLNLPALTNSGLISSGTTLTLSGHSLTNSGEINADNLTAFNDVILNNEGGSLLAGQALQLNNQQLTNGGKMAAAKLSVNSDTINNSGTLQAKQTLQTQSQQLTNSGTLLSEDQLSLDTTALSNAGSLQGRLLNVSADSWLNSGKVLSLADGALTTGSLNNTGSIFSQQTLQLSSGETDNNGLIQGTTALRFSGQRLNNLADGTVISENSFGLDLPELNNAGLISSSAALNLSGGSLTNSGEISAASITADNDSFSNQQGGLLLADNAVQLNNDTLANAGQIAASQLDVNSAIVENSGTLQGKQTLQATGQQLTNSGTVLSGGQLTLKQDRLDNRGQLQGQQLDLTAGDWQNSGNALSAGDATIAASTLTNSGKILGQQHIALNAGSTDNSGWLLAQALTLQGDLVNSGLMQGSDALMLQGGKLVNQGNGQLLTAGKAEVQGSSLDNQGSIQADQLDLTLQSWQNAGSARAGSQLSASVSGALDNSGKLMSEQAMSLHSSQLSNTGTLAADRLTITAPQLTNSGLLQGNSALSLSSTDVTNTATGELITGDSLSLAPVTLNNAGLLQVAGDLSLTGHNVSNSGRITATNLNASLDGSLDNSASGLLLAQQQADIQVNTLNNAGTVAAQQVKTSGAKLQNQGLLQGDALLTADFGQFDNLLHGQLVSGGELSLKGDTASNAGVWQGKNLGYHFTALSTSGTINGTGSLSGTSDTLLDNSGSLLSGGSASVLASSLTNSGKIMADSLTLRGDSLSNQGLWQGTTALDAQASDRLVQYSGGQALTGGDLQLNAGTLETAGTLQGESAHVSAGTWQHQGSLLSSTDLTASVSGDLNNQGELLAQGIAQIDAQNLNNSGKLLAEKDVTLSGSSLTNSGTIQGDTLAIRPASVTNQGSLIGLQSLTLGPAPAQGFRLLALQAQPTRVLVNNAGGQLLTQGTLHISGDAVTNNGTWQGQQILLDATRLTNGGAIQSAGDLQLDLSDTLASGTGSKITANGTATLNALNFTNQGQWIAQNLTIQGGTLENSGEISGVTGLTTALTGALTQQQNAALLSGGTLDVHAATLNNAGRMQGKDLLLNSAGITNSGRMQGDSSLVVNASGRLTNNASGTLLSQNGLTLTAPELYNYGLIQSATSRITTSGLTNNSGKVLSSADLTLNAPQLINSGWLQASQLTLNAASASNSGTLMADQQATLTGTSLQNQGSAQGGNLTVNYAQLTNSGTLLGANQLNVKATSVTQQAAGKLFSGGTLLLESTGFDQLGQVVALGDATLKLINGFTARNTLAAGGRLSISSNGAIDNQGTLQGQVLTLNAGGDLSNNGQLTTGTGDSSLSGQRINMNGSGTLQGGGNVALTSRSDVALNGFTGTRGNLTITSPGSIVNTALLYAGQNLYLYAKSIQNQRGDMLAGNSLWMQRDAAGNANGEVVNTSGTIESQNGDITVRTANLLNQREGLTTQQNTQQISGLPAGIGGASIKYQLSKMNVDDLGYYIISVRTGGSFGKGNGSIDDYSYLAPNAQAAVKCYLTETTTVTAQASGGSGRISAGRNLDVTAGQLNNLASSLLAGNSISLSGTTLNNQSWVNGVTSTYLTYKYDGRIGVNKLNDSRNMRYFSPTSENSPFRGNNSSATVTYQLSSAPEYETTYTGDGLRAVIQAGGSVNASFSGDISNTSTTPNAGWAGTTVSAPSLNHVAAVSQVAAQQRQQLAATDKVAINSPEWRDQLQNALQQVNGGTSLQNTQPETIGLSSHNGKQQSNANLGKAAELASGRAVKPSALGSYGATAVDTSAYPLPTSDNGYFVPGDSSSPYLITVNPKLNGLGKLDSSLFGDLNQLLGKQPGSAPQETRQQYTDVNTFLGSSYLLDRLNLKPDNDYRFLGDAAFDTRYVSNAVLNQTGSRYLNGVGSDLDQMRYLMDNAAASQQSLGLQFGVSLTAEQVASLDKSIIWWEATSVNGQTVMVPKVYLSEKDAAMNNGSVIAGNNVTLSGGNITNSASTVVAQNAVSADSQNNIDNLSAGLIKAGGDLQLGALNNINNVSSTISGKKVALESVNGDINNTTVSAQWTIVGNGAVQASKTLLGQTAAITSLDALSLKSGNDINITGASLNAGGDLLLNAWHDLSLNNIATSESRKTGNKETHSSGAESTTVSSGGNLTLTAGQDITSQAAALAAEGNIGLKAGRDINLNAAESGSGNSERGSNKTVINETVRQQGTEITGKGSTSLTAGRDITSQASNITADQDLSLKAGRNVDLTTATESDYAYREETKTKKGFLKKTTTHTIQEDSVTREKASQLSGNTVSVIAGNDLTVQGSSIAGDKGVALSAGHDLNIVTATNTDSTYSLKEVKKSGLMGGKLGLSYGKQSAKSERNGEQVTQSDARSLVGAGNGAVTLTAGNNALIKGSDVVAGGQNGDISVTAKNIAIVAGQDQVRETAKQESKSSGFGLSLNLGPLDTVRNLRDIMSNTSSVYDQVKQVGNEFGASALDSPAPGLTYGRSDSKASQNTESVYQSGSTLNATGNLTLKARGDADTATGNILVQGSSLNAGGKASLDATRNIDITSAADSQKAASSSSSKNWSATTSASIGALARSGGGSPNNGSAGTNYGSKNSQMSGDSSILTQHTSSITAGSIDVTSHKGDIGITGSTLTGTTGVSLNAEQGNVSVVAGEDRQQASASGSDHTIGDLGGDGYSGTVGVGHNSWKNASAGTQQNTVRSGIVSNFGNVTVNAGKDVNLKGADVYAGNALNVNGENIHLDPAKDTHDASSSSKSSQYGITAQVSGYGVSMAQAADKFAQSHKQSDDPRLQAIYAAQAAMTALSAYTQNTAAVKVTVSATAGSSHQSVEQSSTQQSGSVLKAGGDVAVTAKEDITGEGVKISGDNVSLSAGRDIALSSATDSSSQKSSSGGSKYGVGVGFGLGGSQNGFSIELAASQNSANGNGSSITHHNSEVNAAGDLTVKAGQDVTLNGANLNGHHVDLDAGRNLEIASQQDRASYDSHQSASGFSASICVPPICAGVPVQGSASMSGSKLYNDFDSVQQQSGISAGDGGYNIYVGNHTQLDGAVIASSATPDKNHLSTGTLGWTDIENHANSGGSGFSVAVSGSMGKTTSPASDSFINNIPKSGQPQPSGGNSPPMGTLQQTQDSASSTTYSAISPGTIEIRNPHAQKQDVSQISRDTAAAENALKDKFDAQKAENSLAIQREIAALGQQTIQVTFDYLKAQEKDKAKAEEMYGIGSKLQIAAQAISGLFAGLAGGNVSGAVAAGAAPLLAQMVKQAAGENEPLRVLLHTLASGLIAKAQGGSAIGGAAGGLTAGLLSSGDALSEMLFGKKAYQLSADEKMLVANIVTLAGAVAGGAVDGSAGVGSGGSAGRTEVENNYLSANEAQIKSNLERKEKAGSISENEAKELADLRETDKARDQAIHDICTQGNKGGDACGALVAEAQKALDSYGESAAGYRLIFSDLYPEDAKNAQDILKGLDEGSISRDRAITAITQANKQDWTQDDWNKTAEKYDTAMQMQAITATIAGLIGVTSESVSSKQDATKPNEGPASSKPAWLQRLQEGNKFNAEQSKNYPYNEVYINKPDGKGYYRLDSYNPISGEIVSRKYTQLSDIQINTAKNYINETMKKYPAGATIAKVPSSGEMSGKQLQGSNILEVPPQLKPVPQNVIDIANKAGVIIRDTNGKIY